jgi:hypothetical protein
MAWAKMASMVNLCWMVLAGESDSAGAGDLFQTAGLELSKRPLDERKRRGK